MDQNLQNNQSLNLLSKNIYDSPTVVRIRPKVIIFSKIIIVLIQLFFIGIIVFEYKTTQDILKYHEQAEQLDGQIRSLAPQESQIRNLVQRIEKYKELEKTTNAQKRGEKLATLLESAGTEVIIESVESETPYEFKTSGIASNVLSISLFINNLFESDIVDEIILEQIGLNTREGSYSSQITVKFRE